jgi:hypothetical protein
MLFEQTQPPPPPKLAARHVVLSQAPPLGSMATPVGQPFKDAQVNVFGLQASPCAQSQLLAQVAPDCLVPCVWQVPVQVFVVVSHVWEPVQSLEETHSYCRQVLVLTSQYDVGPNCATQPALVQEGSSQVP